MGNCVAKKKLLLKYSVSKQSFRNQSHEHLNDVAYDVSSVRSNRQQSRRHQRKVGGSPRKLNSSEQNSIREQEPQNEPQLQGLKSKRSNSKSGTPQKFRQVVSQNVSKFRQVLTPQQIKEKKEAINTKLIQMKFSNIDINNDQQMNMERLKSYLEKDQYLMNVKNFALQKIISTIQYCSIKKQEEINNTTNAIDFIIILDEGTAEIINYNKEICPLQVGKVIGLEQLLLKISINQTIKTITKCNFWVLYKEYLSDALFRMNQESQTKVIEVLKQNEFLSISFFEFIYKEQFEEDVLIQLSQSFVKITCQKGDILLEKHQEISNLIIIEQGNIFIDEGKARFGEGQVYEEFIFLNDGESKGNVLVEKDNTKCLLLNKLIFEKKIGENYLVIFQSKFILKKGRFLSQVARYLSELKLGQLVKLNVLAEQFDRVVFHRNEIVQEKNTPFSRVFLVLQGELKFVYFFCFLKFALEKWKENLQTRSNYII